MQLAKTGLRLAATLDGAIGQGGLQCRSQVRDPANRISQARLCRGCVGIFVGIQKISNALRFCKR